MWLSVVVLPPLQVVFVSHTCQLGALNLVSENATASCQMGRDHPEHLELGSIHILGSVGDWIQSLKNKHTKHWISIGESLHLYPYDLVAYAALSFNYSVLNLLFSLHLNVHGLSGHNIIITIFLVRTENGLEFITPCFMSAGSSKCFSSTSHSHTKTRSRD